MPSAAKKSFDENKADVERLWEIHAEVAGEGKGKKHGVEVLNRAAIVFVNAAWEAYVEDLARVATAALKTLPPATLPGPTKAAIGMDYKERKNPQDVWLLAGDGWKTAFDQHVNAVLSGFNTPKTKNVDRLFEELLGLKHTSSQWSWKGISSSSAAEKLDGYVTARGAIVHRLKGADSLPVWKSEGTDYLHHVERLVDVTDEIVRAHLEKLLGKAPW